MESSPETRENGNVGDCVSSHSPCVLSVPLENVSTLKTWNHQRSDFIRGHISGRLRSCARDEMFVIHLLEVHAKSCTDSMCKCRCSFSVNDVGEVDGNPDALPEAPENDGLQGHAITSRNVLHDQQMDMLTVEIKIEEETSEENVDLQEKENVTLAGKSIPSSYKEETTEEQAQEGQTGVVLLETPTPMESEEHEGTIATAQATCSSIIKKSRQGLPIEHKGAKRIKVEDIPLAVNVESDDSQMRTHNREEQEKHILYRGKWHAFKESKDFYRNSIVVAQKMLSPSSTVNSSVPCACDDELSFIIDSSKLEFPEDVTCDETGKYNRPSYSRCELVVGKENVITLLKAGSHLGGKRYTLLRKYYSHRDTPGFYRTVFELKHDGIRACPNVLIRYEWRTEKTALRLTPHGNSKRDDTPYIRSKKQLLASLKQSSKGETAQVKMNEIFDHEGGCTGIGSFSSVARNRNQVYRHRQSQKKGTDFNRLLEVNVLGGFVRSVGKWSNPRCCLYTDKQIADIKKHCMDGCVLVFDTTFDLGKIFVTIASYRHQGFVNKSNEKNVLMPGPILLHCKKDMETYRYFGDQISQALDNKKIPVFGTDGEKALYKGLRETNSFKESDHLLCIVHHRKDVESKLLKLGVKRNADKILKSIYGRQVKETRNEGLVDSSTEKEYEEGLQFWCTQWDSLEEEETGKDPMFSTWFRQYKSQDVRESMLRPLRQKAGLGDPPRQFTTNDSESINVMVSRWVGGQKSWVDLADSLEAFVRSKYKELEMALMGLGERKVSPGLKELQKTQLEWTHMTMAERKAVLECADLDVEDENVAALSVAPEDLPLMN